MTIIDWQTSSSSPGCWLAACLCQQLRNTLQHHWWLSSTGRTSSPGFWLAAYSNDNNEFSSSPSGSHRRPVVIVILSFASDHVVNLVADTRTKDRSTIAGQDRCFNAPTVGNKFSVICDRIIMDKLAFYAVVKTWHKAFNCPNIIAYSPSSNGYRQKTRPILPTEIASERTKHGGECLFYNSKVRDISLRYTTRLKSSGVISTALS